MPVNGRDFAVWTPATPAACECDTPATFAFGAGAGVPGYCPDAEDLCTATASLCWTTTCFATE